MSDPKRHHILPRAYLENFKTADGFVPCLHKSDGRSFSTSAENAGVRKDFNTIRFSDGTIDRRTIEEFYGVVETDFPRMVQEISSPPVSPEAYEYFVQFAIRQKMRTSRARDSLGNLIKKFQEYGLLDGHSATFSDEENKLLSDAKRGDSAALNQIGLQVSGHYGLAIASQLEDMGFVFLPVVGNKLLITCDEPVMIFGLAELGSSMRVALPLPGLRRVLLFPLTRHVVMYGDTDLKNLSGLVVYNRSASLDPGSVRRINQLLAIHAEEQVMAQPQVQMEISKKILRTTLVDNNAVRPRINLTFSTILIDCIKRIQREMFAPQHMRHSKP